MKRIAKYTIFLILIYYEPSFVLGIGDLGFTGMIFKKTIKLIRYLD